MQHFSTVRLQPLLSRPQVILDSVQAGWGPLLLPEPDGEGQKELGFKRATFSPTSPTAGVGSGQLPEAWRAAGTLYPVRCCPLWQPGEKEQPQAWEW